METKQQIDHLIELAIVQRAELKRLVEQLPVLRTYLLEQINATIEDMEPQLRSDLIEFCDEKTDGKIKEIRSFFSEAKSEFATKSEAFFIELEKGVQARYAQLSQERALALDFADDARKGLEAAAQQEAAKIPGQVSELVKQELARFPRAGELDQLRKEFSEPRGLNPRGKWKSTETYQKLDLVAYNGDSYVSNVNDNREKPSRSSVSWTLSAARGQGSGGGGISSLNDILGAPTSDFNVVGAEGSNYVRKTLTAGTNVTLEETPTTITINASDVAAQTLTATVVNAESVAITRGQVVYAFAATGNKVSVKLAYNTSDATSAKTFGVVSDDSIAAGATGTVTCVGVVDKLALGTYSEGDTVYLSATPGAFTATKPYAPNHLVYVGFVERANNGNGELYVKIQNGYELDEIHDVQIITSPAAGAVLVRDATNSLWKAAQIAGAANQITVTNADAAVTLSLPTAITNVNSITAQSATNLTLNGGSSGASIVAGQGTNANITLTPSGTGSIVNGAATFSVTQTGYLKAGSSTARVLIGPSGGTGTIAAYDGSGVITLSYNGSNLLLGTGTDSSNGRLQLATHNTIAGGIGFGTDVSLIRAGAGTLQILSGSTTGAKLTLYAPDSTSANTLSWAHPGSRIWDLGTVAGSVTTLKLTVTSPSLCTFSIDPNVSIAATTASTSTSTGALIVSGGVGVAGQGWFGNYVTVDTTSGAAYRVRKSNAASGSQSWNSTLDSNGNWIFQCANDNFVGANTAFTFTRSGLTPTGMSIAATTASTSITSGALVVSGGVGVGGALYANGIATASGTNINIGGNYLYVGATSNFYLRATGSDNGLIRSAVFSIDTSADFQVRNAAGSSSYFKVDTTTNQTQVLSTTESTSSTTGALITSGGLGVAKNLNAGGNNASHTITGGDGGSGSTILSIRDASNTQKVIFQGNGQVQFAGTILANASSNAFRIANSQTPASASNTGTTGTICWDASYIYVCTATNTWKRVAIATW